jgi:hypothetical protein
MRTVPGVILSLSKGVGIGVVVLTLAAQPVAAHELALAQGTVAIHDAPAGQVAPACSELVVEARGALDNHLIARTRAELANDGACRYALSVPAQSAVWLRLRPVLVDAARVEPPFGLRMTGASDDHRASSRSVQLRFTIISPNTYFFAPGEQKTVPLSY